MPEPNPSPARRTRRETTTERLRRHGWREGSAADFLDLTPAEATLVDLKLDLSGAVRRYRLEQGLTQTQLAQQLGSSQSRVAKIEAGDPSVSVDLLLKALLTLGSDRADLARWLEGRV